jgi:Concanavalin A-like lectin/glucanases superfamily/Bacterial Ig domain/Calx-beta domain/Putative Ig domain
MITESRILLSGFIIFLMLAHSMSYANTSPIAGFGYTLGFDGNPKRWYVLTDEVSHLTLKKQVTIEVWFKTTDKENNQILVELENQINANTWESTIELAVENEGRVRASARSSKGWTNVISASVGPFVSDGLWHHAVGIVSKQAVSLYIDGQFIHSEKGMSKEETDLKDNFFIRLGNDKNSERPFSGQMDEVRIWDSVRSEEDLKATRYKILPNNEPGLVAYFNFDEGTGEQVYDKVNGWVGHFNNGQDLIFWGISDLDAFPIIVQEDTAFNGLLPAYDPEGDMLNYRIIDNSSNGTVQLDPNGSFIYTPYPDVYGSDSFSYQVNDGQADSNLAKLQVIIEGVNDAPHFLAADLPVINENAGAQLIPHWAEFNPGASNESNQEVDSYFVTKISNSSLFAQEPTLDANGNLYYTPAQDKSGTSSFQVTVKDNGNIDYGGHNLSPPQTFTIQVRPIATTPTVSSAVTQEDVQTTQGLVIDPQGDLSITHFKINHIIGGTLFQSNGITPIKENEFITVAQGNPGLRFTPTPNRFGQASFAIQAATGNHDSELGGDIVQASITIQPVADDPTITPASTVEGAQTTQGLVISRHPADGEEVTHFKMTQITNGTLFHHDGITPIHEGDFITFAQGQAGLKFTPASVAAGYFQVQAAISNQDSGLGGLPVTATIQVSSINEPPILNKMGNKTVSLDQLLDFKATASDPDVPAQNLTFSLVNAPVGAIIDSKTGHFIWTPTTSGVFEVTVMVTDDGTNPNNLSDSETMMIKVTAAPVLEPIAKQVVPIETPVTFTAKATYPGHEPLIFNLVEPPGGASIDEKTGEFIWTPVQTGTVNITIRVTEPIGNLSAETTVPITVMPVATRLELNLDSVAIFQKGTLKVSGQLQLFPSLGVKPDLIIQLTVTAPDGQVITKTTATAASGEYTFTDLPVFDQLGRYIFQATFAGTNTVLASQSAPQSLVVSALAGYAVLIQGRIADGSGMESYNKSLNRVYQHLKDRYFIDQNIDYFNYSLEQAGVDTIPTKADIATTLEQLPQRLNANPAPLYLVMIDHGDLAGHFYLDNGNGEKITPSELNTWLTQLEQALTPPALAQPRIIIVGSCYSGSLLPVLSAPGRVIITSTAPGEESYKGPKEPDEIRSGEFFVEALFAHLNKGRSLKTAFELATASTEAFTRINDSAAVNPWFQDKAAQHPLLDDDGDKQGHHLLYSGADGGQVDNIYLGLGTKYDEYADHNPAEIWTVTPHLQLGLLETSANLFAIVNHPERVKEGQVLVDIRPPSLQLSTDGTEQTESLEIQQLARTYLTLTEGNRFTGQFDQFEEVGQYEIFYSVRDKLTGELSPLYSSVVYKAKVGNQPPQPFKLYTPTEGQKTATTLILDWENTFDPEGGTVSYTLIIATDPAFHQEVYRQTQSISMAYINRNTFIWDPLNPNKRGLRDGTTYFWKVQAIDKYGAMAESTTFSFQTNNTNAPPSLASIQIFSAIDFISLENARLDFWQVDEFGHLILDELGNPLLLEQPPILYQDQGFYNLLLPYGRRRATIELAGYQSQDIELDTESGLTTLNVAMTPIGGNLVNHGQLQFAVAQTTLAENRDEIDLIVNRVGGDDGEVSVLYDTLAGTAASDYLLTPGKLTWSDKDSRSQKILLTILDDNQFEGDESFTLILHTPTGGAGLGTNNQLVITLVDNEQATDANSSGTQVKPPQDETSSVAQHQAGTLQFLATTYYVNEGIGPVTAFTVTRNEGSEGAVTVQYTITDESTANIGLDYLGGIGILSWADGDNTPKAIDLTLVDDQLIEDPETIQLRLENSTGEAKLGLYRTATLIIIDNDKIVEVTEPTDETAWLQFTSPIYWTNEEEKSLELNVTRTGSSKGEISVQYVATVNSTATAGEDYLGDSGTLHWSEGDEQAKTFTISLLDDDYADEEFIHIILFKPTGTAQLGTLSETILVIQDKDKNNHLNQPSPASIQFIKPADFINESSNEIFITVMHTGENTEPITVNYETIDDTAIAYQDYLPRQGRLTWLVGENGIASITIPILEDQLVEAEESFIVKLSNPNSNAQLGTLSQFEVRIQDDDALPTTAPLLLPSLGQGVTVNANPGVIDTHAFTFCYEQCPIATAFRGGVSLNKLSYHNPLSLHSHQPVKIIGEMDIDPQHVNQMADILIVAGWKPLPIDDFENYFLRDNQGQIQPWDLNLAHLVAARPKVKLAPTQSVEIYSGSLSRGNIAVFFGYRLKDGTLIFNGEQPIEIQVQ